MSMLSEVSKTALITLKGRVIEAQKHDPIISDPVGCECLKRIVSLLPAELKTQILGRKMRPSLPRYLALRARKYDTYAKDFLDENPDGLVVNLGCGFDTRYWRVSKEPWKYIEVDLPAVMGLKQKVLKDMMTYSFIGCSVLEDQWIKQVLSIQKDKVLFLAEGLFMYLPEEGVRRIIKKLSESFSKSYIALDVVNKRYTRGIRKRLVAYKMRRHLGLNAETSFVFGVNDSRDIESYGENIKVVEEWSYLQEDEVIPSFIHHFRNIRFLSRAQYSIRAMIE